AGTPAEIRQNPVVQEAYLGAHDPESEDSGPDETAAEQTRTDLPPVAADLTQEIPAVKA
ncbi:MAG: hypothetical protein ACK4MU_09205, partial [Thermomonas sp.]